jgi:hypothetical protein
MGLYYFIKIKAGMKKQAWVVFLSSALILLAGCNNNPPKEEPGVKVEGKKGGEMKIDKDKLQIEGKKGGELKIDSNGAKIEKPTSN